MKEVFLLYVLLNEVVYYGYRESIILVHALGMRGSYMLTS